MLRRIGVGRTGWVRSPLPPNRACGFPAHGSPVNGFTSERIDRPEHGLWSGRTAGARQRNGSPFISYEIVNMRMSPDLRFDPGHVCRDRCAGISPFRATFALEDIVVAEFLSLGPHHASVFLHP